MPITAIPFEIGDTVVYRNPETKKFEHIQVTGIDQGRDGGARFVGIQKNGPFEEFFGLPVFVVGARVEHVEDVIKA